MSVLALTHRPVRFKDVVAQNHVKAVLQAMVKSDRVHPALIFSGPRGTGKTTSARILAAALNCLNSENGDACGECRECISVQRATSTSVMEIDAASTGGVNEVRRLQTIVQHAHTSKWRVIILDEAQSMSKEAYNALLKLLEEPPPSTMFILVTTEPEKILGTVRSRSMPFEFRRIRNTDIVSRLQQIAEAESFTATQDLCVEIAKYAQGGLRDAVMVLDQISRVGVENAAQFQEFYGIADYSISLMWAAIRGDHAEGYRLVSEHFSRTGEAASMVTDLSRLVSELLIIKSEGRPKDYSEESISERVDMARAVSSDRLVQVAEVLWDLRNRTRMSENDQRSSMELAFALIAKAVKSETAAAPRKPIQTEVATPTPRLGIHDMARLAQ